ncbi:MAG: hypothetical protein AB1806_08335 [Acidobacteriota bacterium]
MKGFWRLLAIVAALNVAGASGVAMAQSVSVIKAPPGARVELVLNTAQVGSTTANARGVATLTFDLSAQRGRTEIDATIFVDACEGLRRVLLIEPGVVGPAGPGECTRREIAGVYVLREVTSFVVDVSDPLPSVRFRQGPAPEAWLDPDAAQGGPSREWGPLPVGLIAFGGGGLSLFSNQVFVACGNEPECTGSRSRLAPTAGIDVWFKPFLGAEVSYVKPADVVSRSAGESNRFDNTFDTQIVAAAGKIGVPMGRVRVYGKGGATYSRATSTTNQTIDDYTVTVDDVEQTIVGGTQSFGLRVTGWRWFAGGGAEVWVSPRVAIYGEFVRMPIKGTSAEGGEGTIDEAVNSTLAGIRIRITR